ncbi:MAG: hypothetical protein QOD11_465 [Bradyrhizobium sp.]|nr:hypothetical protein [Bradyrhizobium sp.]
MEHTVVEAFDGQLRTNVDFESFVTPIIDALDLNLPSPGYYQLSFSIHPSKNMKPKDIARARTKIIEWVARCAGELHDECPEQPERNNRPQGHHNTRKGCVEGIELALNRQTGWWVPDQIKGRVLASRIAPKDYENLRRKRLNTAMDKKLPKLQKWKSDGACSILVLENRDMALSNHFVILEAAEHAFEGRSDRPDEVWLVDTTTEQEWTVWCLIRDDIAFPDGESEVRYREFKPEDLIEV